MVWILDQLPPIGKQLVQHRVKPLFQAFGSTLGSVNALQQQTALQPHLCGQSPEGVLIQRVAFGKPAGRLCAF